MVLCIQSFFTAFKSSFFICISNKWSYCAGESHWEHLHGTFYLGIKGSSLCKTFKNQAENTGMGKIRKKEVIKGKSQSVGIQKLIHKESLCELFLAPVSLGPISDQPGFVATEAVLVTD